MAAMIDSELLVFVHAGGDFKDGCQGRKGNGVSHAWRACTKPECPRELRPCLNCGKPGHFSRDCQLPKAALAFDGGGRVQQQLLEFRR